MAVSLLREHHTIDASAMSAIERLLLDPGAGVRYQAMLTLLEGGRIFSEAEVKSILVKSPLGGSYITSDFAGERNLAHWHKRSLAKMSIVDQRRK
jgi:hypothetical protein